MELRTLLAAAFLWASTGAWGQGVNLFPGPGSEGSGERELKALASAYPDRITQVEQRDGDWAMDVKGGWFFWAHGRILAEPDRADWQRYAPFRFYPYPLGGLPPLPRLDARTTARLKKALEEARVHPPRRSEAFLERLYDAASGSETRGNIVTVDFLGFKVEVHRRIAEPLAAVAAECQVLRRTDPAADSFFAEALLGALHETLEDALARFVVHDDVVDRIALGRGVLRVAADVEVEAGAVLEEDVARPAPRNDPAEQVAGDLVGAEPALAAQCARDAVLVLEAEDAALHRCECRWRLRRFLIHCATWCG